MYVCMYACIKMCKIDIVWQSMQKHTCASSCRDICCVPHSYTQADVCVISASRSICHILRITKAAFTPDTCSLDTSELYLYLYPFVSPVAVYMYPVSATKLSSRRHVSTRCSSGIVYLYPTTLYLV